MNKRGIEPVIATVLLIVITIALVAIVVSFVVPFVQDTLKRTELCTNAKLEIKDVCLETAKPYKFMVANDLHYGRGNPHYETSYNNLSLWVTNTPNLNRLFLNGDLTYADGIYTEHITWVKNFLDNNIKIKVPYTVIMGNHDGPGAFFQTSFGLSDLNYSFDENGYHFIIMKDEYATSSNARNWLQQDLINNKEKPTFIFMHQPQSKIYCVNHDCKNPPQNTQIFTSENPPFLQIINQSSNVVGVFYGHVHNWAENIDSCGPVYSPMHCEFNITTQTDVCFGGYALQEFAPCNMRNLPPYNNFVYPRTPPGYRIVEIFPNGTIYTAYRNSTEIFNQGTFQSNRIYDFSNIRVRVGRGKEQFDLSNIVFGLSNETGMFAREINQTLNPYEEKEFVLRGVNINKIKITPVIKEGNKKYTCDYGPEVIVKPCAY